MNPVEPVETSRAELSGLGDVETARQFLRAGTFLKCFQALCAQVADALGDADEPALSAPEIALLLVRYMLVKYCRANGWLYAEEAMHAPGQWAFSSNVITLINQALDGYCWFLAHADCVPPALLGTLFEQSLAQRQTGAYYTDGDVTRYICAQTILPAVLWRWHAGGLLTRMQQQRLEFLLESEGRVSEADWTALTTEILETCQEADTLNALYDSLAKLTILDPTCGTGDFLLAAAETLLPIHEHCLARWAALSSEPFPSELSALALILSRNLYGVDLMPEAIEVCRLRLTLRWLVGIASSGEPVPTALVNQEELPDVLRHVMVLSTGSGESAYPPSFNLRAGNALTGRVQAEVVQPAEFARPDAAALEVVSSEQTKYQPAVHWERAFPNVISQGGYDVVVGNPPYMELRETDYADQTLSHLETTETGAVHAMCMERSLALLKPQGFLGLIVPMSLVSTQRMQPMQRLLETETRTVRYANFAWRPAKLFADVNRALTIVLAGPCVSTPRTFATGYLKWTSQERPRLFDSVTYVEVPRNRPYCWVPKFQQAGERAILDKLLAVPQTLSALIVPDGPHRIYYRTTGGLYWKIFTDFPPAFRLDGQPGASSREACFAVREAGLVQPVIALLSSSLFWWWYTVSSNCRDVNPYDLRHFPMPEAALHDPQVAVLGAEYLTDLVKNSRMQTRQQASTGRTETQLFKVRASKPLIDRIDRAITRHYGLSEVETEFITGYDLRFRMSERS